MITQGYSLLLAAEIRVISPKNRFCDIVHFFDYHYKRLMLSTFQANNHN